MHVATILKRKGSRIVSTMVDRTVADVADLLTENRIGAVLVMDGDAVAGIISERDIVRALAEHGARALEMPVRGLMTRDVLNCRPTDSIAEVMQVMTDRRIRHLPVLEDGALAGIISIGDVVKERIQETEMEVEALRSYVAGGA